MHSSFSGRVLHFIGDINYSTVNEFIERIRLYSAEEQRKDITIVMSTAGGSTNAALCLHDFIRNQPLPVTMIASGGVDSAGIYPFLAGDNRVAFPTASFLFHPSTIEIEGRYRRLDLIEHVRSMECEDERCASIVTSRTTITREVYDRLVADRSPVSIEQAHKFGIIHGIADYNKKQLPTQEVEQDSAPPS